MNGTHTRPATRISSQRTGLSMGGRLRNATNVNARNSATATTSSHGLFGLSRAWSTRFSSDGGGGGGRRRRRSPSGAVSGSTPPIMVEGYGTVG